METARSKPPLLAPLPARVTARLVSVPGGHVHWRTSGARRGRPQVKWQGQAIDATRLLAGLLNRPDLRMNRRCHDRNCIAPAHFEVLPWQQSLAEARAQAPHHTTLQRVAREAGRPSLPEDAPGFGVPDSEPAVRRLTDRERRLLAFEAFHYGPR